MIITRSFLACTIIIFNFIVPPNYAVVASNRNPDIVPKRTNSKRLPKRKNQTLKKKCKGKGKERRASRNMNANDEYDEYVKIEGLTAGIVGKVSKGTKSPTSKGTKSPSSKGTKSPSSKGTKSPTSKGKKSDIECEGYIYPSASPSISIMPSASPSYSPSGSPTISAQPSSEPTTAPSTLPTFSPSAEPSSKPTGAPSGIPSLSPIAQPSMSPSISHMPSVSMEPTISAIPTPSPSFAFSPWCDSLSNDNSAPPPQTTYQIEGTYVYEILYQNSGNITTILQNLDKRILQELINDHVWCGNNTQTRRSRSLSLAFLKPGHVVGLEVRTNRQSRSEQRSRSLLIDGISLDGADTINTNSCSELTSSTSATTCEVYDGSYTLYLRESSELNTGEAKDNVLETIRTGMNSGSLAEGDDDIEELHYHGETIDNGSSTNFGDVFTGFTFKVPDFFSVVISFFI